MSTTRAALLSGAAAVQGGPAAVQSADLFSGGIEDGHVAVAAMGSSFFARLDHGGWAGGTQVSEDPAAEDM